MKVTTMVVLVVVFVLGGVLGAWGQGAPFDNPAKIEAFVDGFGLSNAQVQKILTALDESFKKEQLVRQKMDAVSVLLEKELAKNDANEAKVVRYIDDISRAEAAIRTSKVITWLRVRKLLSKQQRDAIKDFGKKPEVSVPDCDRTDPLCGLGPPAVQSPLGASGAPKPFVKPELSKLPSLGRVRDRAMWKKLLTPSVAACAKTHGFEGLVFVELDVEKNGRGRVSRITDGNPPFRQCVVDRLASVSVGQKEAPQEDRRYRIRIVVSR